MQTLFECIPCIVRQSLDIARLNDLNEQKKLKLLRTLLKRLLTVDPLSSTPPEITKWAHEIIKKQLKKKDLYARAKKRENESALKLFPWAVKEVRRAKDRLLTAVKLAVAGNIIDYGTASFFDLETSLKEIEKHKFRIDHYPALKKALKTPKKVLYIGDNAGEIVFDKLLVQELLNGGHQITFAVKSDYVLNDATLADAKFCRMTRLVPVIESGSTTAGTLLKEATPTFNKIYKQAGLIIAKGQGNFETLPADDPRIFFLLKMKCVYLGKKINVSLGDILLIQGNKKISKLLN